MKAAKPSAKTLLILVSAKLRQNVSGFAKKFSGAFIQVPGEMACPVVKLGLKAAEDSTALEEI